MKHIFQKKISIFDITIFFRQLSTLISASVPIIQSLEILRHAQEKLLFQKLIYSIKNEIESGKTLTNALRKFPRYFDDLTCHLIHAGEQSGTLDTMLKRIAHYKEKSLTLKNRIKQALFYPSIISFVAIAVTIIMLTFVVPRFADLFQSMHSHLPAFTLFIVGLSNLLRENSFLFLIPIIACIIVMYYFKTSREFKNYIDHILLKIPILNTLIQKIILARLTRSLATTYAAGVPITQALKTIAHLSSNHDYTQAIIGLQTQVASGQQLHTAMRMNILFPIMPIQMIKIGEESGTLEHMLEKIADIYESDIEHWVANLSHLLEPLIMIILGVLIGGLVIAMYLPIFKLGTVI